MDGDGRRRVYPVPDRGGVVIAGHARHVQPRARPRRSSRITAAARSVARWTERRTGEQREQPSRDRADGVRPVVERGVQERFVVGGQTADEGPRSRSLARRRAAAPSRPPAARAPRPGRVRARPPGTHAVRCGCRSARPQNRSDSRPPPRPRPPILPGQRPSLRCPPAHCPPLRCPRRPVPRHSRRAAVCSAQHQRSAASRAAARRANGRGRRARRSPPAGAQSCGPPRPAGRAAAGPTPRTRRRSRR